MSSRRPRARPRGARSAGRSTTTTCRGCRSPPRSRRGTPERGRLVVAGRRRRGPRHPCEQHPVPAPAADSLRAAGASRETEARRGSDDLGRSRPTASPPGSRSASKVSSHRRSTAASRAVVVDDGAPVALDEVEAFAPRLRVRALLAPGASRRAERVTRRRRGATSRSRTTTAWPSQTGCVCSSPLVERADAIAGGTVRNLRKRIATRRRRSGSSTSCTRATATARPGASSPRASPALDARHSWPQEASSSPPLPGGEDRELCER